MNSRLSTEIEKPDMTNTTKVQVSVGSLTDMGKRFAGAWNSAVAGMQVSEAHVMFVELQTMLEALSPKSLELLRHVRQYGAGNVRELSQALKRDYRSVNHDVSLLRAAGLLQRHGRKLTVPWDELQANVSLMTC